MIVTRVDFPAGEVKVIVMSSEVDAPVVADLLGLSASAKELFISDFTGPTPRCSGTCFYNKRAVVVAALGSSESIYNVLLHEIGHQLAKDTGLDPKSEALADTFAYEVAKSSSWALASLQLDIANLKARSEAWSNNVKPSAPRYQELRANITHLEAQTMILKQEMLRAKEIMLRGFRVGDSFDATCVIFREDTRIDVELERMTRSDFEGLVLGLTEFGTSRGIKVGLTLGVSSFAGKSGRKEGE